MLDKLAPICCIVGGSIIYATAQAAVPAFVVCAGPLATIAVGTAAGVALLLVPRGRRRKARRAA